MQYVKQLTKEEAIAFDENKGYENMTAKQIVDLQLFSGTTMPAVRPFSRLSGNNVGPICFYSRICIPGST